MTAEVCLSWNLWKQSRMYYLVQTLWQQHQIQLDHDVWEMVFQSMLEERPKAFVWGMGCFCCAVGRSYYIFYVLPMAALSLLLTACFIVLYRVFFAMEFVALSHESPQFRTDIREPVFFLACLKGIYFSSALCSSFLKDISLVEVNEPSFWEFTNAEQKVDICLSKPTQYTFLYRKIFRCFWV